MTTSSSPSVPAVPDDTLLRLAVAAHLARYKGASRDHVDSDLRCFLRWCQQRALPPLDAIRPQIELYVRWMQEVQGYKPSTVSRRLSVIVGFYRTCVIDSVLEHSPADYVRRPHVPPESPSLGLSHLQFEAVLTTARDSSNACDFALVAMLGLLGLRIFEATGSNIEGLGESHGHRVLRVHGKGDKTVLTPLPPAVARAIDRATDDRSAGPILLSRTGSRMDRHAATRRLRALAREAGRPATANAPTHAAPHLRHHHARRRRAPSRRPDRRSTRRPANHHALGPSTQEPRPTPQLHPRRLHGLRNVSRRDSRSAPSAADPVVGPCRRANLRPLDSRAPCC
jgi:integrase/recombinase XerD